MGGSIEGGFDSFGWELGKGGCLVVMESVWVAWKEGDHDVHE